MTTFHRASLSCLLMLGAAMLALGSCDSGDTSGIKTDDTVITSGDVPARPTWAGAYLSSRVAQGRFDWTSAEEFIASFNSMRPGNVQSEKRAMLLALGAGDFDTALGIARKQDPAQDPSGLIGFITLIDAIRNHQLVTAQRLTTELPRGALTSYAQPLFNAWFAAAGGRTSLDALRKDRGYYYQMVLIADFLDQIDLAADKNMLLAAQSQLTTLSAERLGDIFLRRHKYDLALLMYKLLQTTNTQSPYLKEKINAATNKSTDLAGLSLAPKIGDVTEGIASIFTEMGSAFYSGQSFESAQLFARMALALDPEQVDARLLIGNLLARNERIDDAVAEYERVPATSARYKAVQQQIASLRVQQKRDDDAIKALDILLKESANDAEKIGYYMQIGDIYRQGEKYKPALDAYNDAADILNDKIPAEYWELLYARGMTLERLKRWDEAQKDLEAALAYQPDHPYLLNYLGYSWADRGQNLDHAIDLLKHAVKLVPNDGYVVDSVGWAYYRIEKYDEAVKFLEQAVALMPYDPTVNDHLGDAYYKVGRKREAMFQWNRARNYSEEAEQQKTISEKIDKGGI